MMPDHNETNLTGNAANVEQLFRYGDAGSYAASQTIYILLSCLHKFLGHIYKHLIVLLNLFFKTKFTCQGSNYDIRLGN